MFIMGEFIMGKMFIMGENVYYGSMQCTFFRGPWGSRGYPDGVNHKNGFALGALMNLFPVTRNCSWLQGPQGACLMGCLLYTSPSPRD